MNKRNHNIDILKGITIIFVILLHSLPRDLLFSSGAPFHFWQAVPIFLLLAGYNTANSYKRRNYESLNEFYNFPFLYKKIERLIYPFLLVWVVQLIVHFVLFNGLSVNELFISLISGGWGPGSYFVPIIIQATLILPLIYLLCKKNLTTMTITLFIISLLVEVACLLVDMPEGVYRLIVVRYLFALTLGVWLALNTKKLNYKWLIPLAILSTVYITGVNYFDWVLIMEHFWLSQHAPSYFWTLMLIIVGLKLYQFKADNTISKLFVKIGQASYHIFLTQMVYFWSIAGLFSALPLTAYVGISIIICVLLGLLFFDAENWVRNLIKNCNHKKIAA